MSTIQALSSPIKRYFITTLALGTALLMTILLWPTLKETPALFFVPVLIVSAWFVGIKSGLKWNQSELDKERDFISKIISTVGSLIVVLDREGRIVSFNQACEKTTGYSHDEVKGKYIWDLLIIPEEIESIKKVFENLVAGSFPSNNENFWQTRNRSSRLIYWSNTAILDKDGKVEYVIGTGLDITDRKAAEESLSLSYSQLENRVIERTAELSQINLALQTEVAERQKIEAALRQNEERFRCLSASSPAGIFMTDIQGQCTYTNPSFQAICGFNFEESLGYGWCASIHPEDRDRVFAEWSSYTNSPREYKNEFRFLTAERGVRWVRICSAPMFSDIGKIIGHVGTLEDITYRVESQQALYRSKQEFKAVVENTPDIIIRIDKELRYIYVNPAVEKNMGMPAAAFLGKTNQELGAPPNLCQLWDETLLKVFASGAEQAIEYQAPTVEGMRTYQSRIVPEFDSDGSIQYALVVARDITELKLAEAQRTQLIAEQTARVKAEASEQQSALMATASAVLSSSLDWETTLKNVGELAVPTLADGCYIDIAETDGTVRRLAATHVEPSKVDLSTQLEQRYPTPAMPTAGKAYAIQGYRLVMRTGQPELIPEITDDILVAAAQDSTHLEMLRSLQLGSQLSVPLTTRGRVLGAITFVTTKAGRRYNSEDLRLLEDLADRIALAVDNAQLYREAQLAQAQAAESFASIDALLEAAPLGICFLDREMRFLRVNEVLAKLNCFPPGEHLGKKFHEILPKCAARFGDTIQQVLDSGEPLLNVEITGECNKTPGQFGYWLGNYYPVKAKDGETLGVGVILTEITEAKRTEAALRESEARFRSVVESNTIGVGFWEQDCKITDANDALLKIIGYTREELRSLALSWKDITPLEYWPLDAEAIAQVQANGSCTPYEKEYIRKDGSRIPILAGGGLIEGCKDRGTFFVLDISDRKQAEAAERQANKKIANILESITDAFFTVNKEWQFTYVNTRFLNMTGLPKAELLGACIWEKFPDAASSPFYEQYHRAMFQQLPIHVEAISSNGSGQWFEARAYPWSDGLAVYFQDITKRKRTEQALRESEARVQRQLAELNHVYNTTPVGLCFVDINLRFVRINEYLAAVNGRAIAQHLGRTVREVIPELADLLEPLYHQVIATGIPILDLEIQAETLQQRGIVRDWLVSYYPVNDSEGRLLGVTKVMQEITERKKAERALRESEAIFRRLFEVNVFGVAIGDFHGQITYANEALLKMVGYTREEMLSGQMRWDRLTPPEQLYLDEIAIAELRTTGVTASFEKEYIHKNGSRVPILIGGAMLAEPFTEQETAIAFYIDMTEIKRVEAELKNNQQRLQLAQQAGKIGTFEWNVQTGEITWTQELEALYGLEPGSFGGKYENWTQLLHPDDIAKTKQEIAKVANSGGELDIEFRICRPDNSIRWIALRATTFNDEQGLPLRTIGVNVDISDRKRIEEALMETNQTLKTLIRACPLGITVFSAEDGSVKMWNPAAEKIFGWSEQEAKGCFLPSVPPDKQEEFQANLKAIRDGFPLTGLETRRQKKDGSAVEIGLWATSVYDAKGNINCMSIVADISDRKRAESERAQLLDRERAARAEAESANRMKDEFLATLSHELRTPLNAILGWAQLLRSRNFNETTTARALETIERQARLQKQLIEDLLDVSRIIQGKLCLNVRWFDLVETLEVAMNSVSLMAGAKSIEIDAFVDPAVGLAWGDAERFQQVIWNLLSNAIKFTPAGGQVEVELRLETGEWGDGGHGGVEMTVRDTGKGISAEFLPYVFERFLQADGSVTRSYGGLGLGLAIARHLVELHGGTISAQSEGEGKGATFTVRLPLKQGIETREVGISPTTASLPSAETPSSNELSDLQVLVVDDETDTSEFLVALLEEYGATAIAVASVGEAIAVLEGWQPDILVSDIGMPIEDGYSLIRKVRALEAFEGEHLPALAITAYAREQDRSQALAAGFDAHIAKPVEPEQLVAVLANLAVIARG
ncbi:PAS domain S-box protein [Kamptonema sp. UHCC 0994]|uniref:PAS domain S-box protein n=1 Tax=Kamptonema sp. UHCC 0994 TaxID=3031329 RepID=UPI0023BAAA05|nr:PAS domain S-box protein [Kamptonema sp. UHCC 0994]MDF0556202.1 PAS domain S-box protein [Kamptonema sp. UHCC 0994]